MSRPTTQRQSLIGSFNDYSTTNSPTGNGENPPTGGLGGGLTDSTPNGTGEIKIDSPGLGGGSGSTARVTETGSGIPTGGSPTVTATSYTISAGCAGHGRGAGGGPDNYYSDGSGYVIWLFFISNSTSSSSIITLATTLSPPLSPNLLITPRKIIPSQNQCSLGTKNGTKALPFHPPYS